MEPRHVAITDAFTRGGITQWHVEGVSDSCELTMNDVYLVDYSEREKFLRLSKTISGPVFLEGPRMRHLQALNPAIQMDAFNVRTLFSKVLGKMSTPEEKALMEKEKEEIFMDLGETVQYKLDSALSPLKLQVSLSLGEYRLERRNGQDMQSFSPRTIKKAANAVATASQNILKLMEEESTLSYFRRGEFKQPSAIRLDPSLFPERKGGNTAELLRKIKEELMQLRAARK